MQAAVDQLLADLIVVLHLAYVLFVLLGFAAIWLGAWLRWGWTRRPAFRITHLACTLVVAVEAVFGVVCPLTEWEHELRVRAGQLPRYHGVEATEPISFVGRLVRSVLFYDAPPWVLTTCYIVFGLVVLATFVWLPPLRRARADAGTKPADLV